MTNDVMPLLDIGLESQVPKYVQVVNAVTDAIRRGKLRKGQKISSINELSEEYYISRVTVEKAYSILREQGTIIPIKGKGFYINKVDIDVPIKVLLLFNKISNYKKQVYQSFIQTLGPKAIVDLKIHHFNVEILRNLVENHVNDYNYFVVMPQFYERFDEAVRILETIPPDQLIIMDRKVPFFENRCAAVYQDFENDIIEALEKGVELLKNYSKLVFVHSNMVPYPPEMVRGFRRFCMQNCFKNEVINEVKPNQAVTKGEAYVVIEETDLANLIKICLAKKLKIGKDIGIISYNETPLKEVLLEGITVISTDHEKMGETAARLILSNSKESIKNPFVLIKRKSL
ncbi:MAG TPA: GntR family transcriptional regulator [Chitinophagaceae bacterium]|jgi:DNA-binding transcriptional regulator YhcF (GntR family)|nr:GntR family transcriptional regulator [Chitinophagaceae bacterium]